MSSTSLVHHNFRKICLALLVSFALLPGLFARAQDEVDPLLSPKDVQEARKEVDRTFDLTFRLHKIGQALGFTPIFSKASAEERIAILIGVVINSFLLALGAIFLIFMFIAGWIWMTAAGSEDKIQKSRNIMKTSVAGILIVSLAYAITKIVGLLLQQAGLFV